MSIRAKPIKLSFVPVRLKRLLDFGREHRMQARSGVLHPGKIIMDIIEFILDVRDDPDIQSYLDREGGTFIDLILRALKKYISDEE